MRQMWTADKRKIAKMSSKGAPISHCQIKVPSYFRPYPDEASLLSRLPFDDIFII